MRFTIEDDGLMADESGNVLGRLVGIEIEIEPIDTPRRSLTPTEIRRLVACPFCRANRGVMCKRWRGGARKANHAERIRAAQEATQ